MHKTITPYGIIESRVTGVITETPSIKTLQIRPREPVPFKTGQFVELTVPGAGGAPFTPSSRPWISDNMEITVMKVGKITGKIHELKEGDTVGIRGPFGRGYPIDSFRNREILVLGGGCGFAPLRSLMYELMKRKEEFAKIVFRGGCKTPADLLYRDEIAGWNERAGIDLMLTVDAADQNWKGNVGLVTRTLDNVRMNVENAVGVLCGPPVMMKYTAQKLLSMGFRDENIYLSMEKNMSCGIGKCGHCRLGTYYACKDGPVFTYGQLKNLRDIWE